jgi:hypothetical protein
MFSYRLTQFATFKCADVLIAGWRYQGFGINGPVPSPSPADKKPNAQKLFGTGRSPKLTFSGKMKSVTGAKY